jgi:hypothetical protein
MAGHAHDAFWGQNHGGGTDAVAVKMATRTSLSLRLCQMVHDRHGAGHCAGLPCHRLGLCISDRHDPTHVTRLTGDIAMRLMDDALLMTLVALQTIALSLLIVPVLIGGGMADEAIQFGMYRALVFILVDERNIIGHQLSGAMAGKTHAAIFGGALGIVPGNFQMTAHARLILFRKTDITGGNHRFGGTFIMGVMAFNTIEKALDFIDGFTAVLGIIFDLVQDMIMALQAFVAVEKIDHCFVHIGRIWMPIAHLDIAMAIEARRLGMHRLQKPVAVDPPSCRCIKNAGCENQYQRNNPPNHVHTYPMVFANNPTHLNQSLRAPFLFHARYPLRLGPNATGAPIGFMVIPFIITTLPVVPTSTQNIDCSLDFFKDHYNWL